MMISETYADLGGGLRVSPPPDAVRVPYPTRRSELAEGVRTTQAPCSHLFDPTSGWCACGIRDDGQIAEGSPAWRSRLEHALPGPVSAA